MRRMRLATWTVALVLLGSLVAGADSAWTPAAWKDEDTVELRTIAAGEDSHWFKVWVAVVDDQLYVRLGRRAVDRIEGNTAKPVVGVRIAGHEFERVRGTAAPEMAERVAEEIARKYWSDVLIRHVAHPLTLRLVPEA